MLNQYNTSEYLLLLQQQVNLQSELDKYICLENNIMSILQNFGRLLNKGQEINDIKTNLLYIVSALQDAKITNSVLIGELQEYVKLMYQLLTMNGAK